MNPALEEAGSTSDTRVKVKHKSRAWWGMPIIPGRVGRRSGVQGPQQDIMNLRPAWKT